MNPLNYGLDEWRQITMTPYEKKRERTIKANFHKPKPPSGGKRWNKGWIVYNTKEHIYHDGDHISVSPNNPKVFHATVGHQHYGIDRYGKLFERTDKNYRYNQYNDDYAMALYEYWKDI
jgi:hypothetical protein